MGDRALVQFSNMQEDPRLLEYGPVVYLHWAGDKVEKWVEELREVMKTRLGDVDYATARFIAIACEHTPGNLSVGVWNADGLLTAEESHGDAGCYIVDVNTMQIARAVGGYGKVPTYDNEN